ncbi:MAG: OsmC family protein [Cyclobacteriaceae bacterium]|nr:OsmC family protein [Cyclobacteriaceae bacterium]
MKRTAKAVWKGTGLEGKGSLTTQSGAFDSQPYSTKLRFENEDGKLGTNPEELIAAAHAGCFAMALSFQLVGAGFTADELNVDAVLVIEKKEAGFEITGTTLNLEGKVPGISEDKFLELANNAKVGCPVSKALKAIDIQLNAKLVS